MEPRRLPQGAIQVQDGTVVIPPSVRADGSVRKEIRVRSGYIPQDEQPLYKPKGRRREINDENDLVKEILNLEIEEKKTTMEEKTRKIPLGAIETDKGDVIIPSSIREDGSKRKEIRVRSGYVPQEEQSIYRPREIHQKNNKKKSSKKSSSFYSSYMKEEKKPQEIPSPTKQSTNLSQQKSKNTLCIIEL